MITAKTPLFQKLVVIAALLTVSAAFSQQVLDRVVAIVDDDIILESQVVQSAYLMALQSGFDPTTNPVRFEAEFGRYKAATLENLINKKVFLIQAEKDTILADERQIDFHLQQQMQSIIQRLGGEEKVQEYFGMSMPKIRKNYREQIEEELRVAAVRDRKMADIKVSRREVEEYYRAFGDSLASIRETVDISHLLLTPEPGDDAVRDAKEKITKIKNQIEAGAEFAQMARENSEDPGSAERGGEIGFMSRGDFVREFEEAAFALQPNELSDIVRTQFGFHLIQMIERRGEKINVRHILIAPKPSQKDELEAVEKIRSIHQELLDGADFEEMVKIHSADESTRDRGGKLGVFEIDQLRETAKEFTYVLNGVEPGQVTEPVKTAFGYHILRLNSREEPRHLELEKDWERIETLALEKKIQNEFNKWLNEIKKTVYIEIKPENGS
ncbi:peptidylprolyl isomerase [candidate division KSB1 bacterium]|nr:peptidylprolyl isomerase [candidate division KSB1 bacterium]